MDARNANASRNRLAIGIRMATVVVVVGSLAAVWHPMSMRDAVSTAKEAAANATAAAPDMSVYFPSRFAAPQNAAPQAPTF